MACYANTHQHDYSIIFVVVPGHARTAALLSRRFVTVEAIVATSSPPATGHQKRDVVNMYYRIFEEPANAVGTGSYCMTVTAPSIPNSRPSTLARVATPVDRQCRTLPLTL